MKTLRTTFIIIGVVVAVLIIAGVGEEVFGGGAPIRTRYTPPPNILPPPTPPGFPYTWFVKDVVKSFNEKELEVKNVKQAAEADHDPVHARAKEITKFSIPSFGEDVGGYIFSFEKKDDFEKMKKHYLNMNEKGELYTWSFVKDNILLVLTGTIPEEKARQYESALNDLKE